MKNNSNENGRSMIEMLGVLAIIGVLSVGGIAGYSKAMTKYRVDKTIEQITLIAGNVRTFFAPQMNYLGVDCYDCGTNGCSGHSGVGSNGNPTNARNGCPIIKKAKILPDEMITLNDDGTKIMSITNPFGGRVYLFTANKSTAGDNQAFGIDLVDLPQEACIELATHDWTSAGAYAVSLNDTYRERVPVDLSIATEVCDDESQLYFHFNINVNSEYWQDKSTYQYQNLSAYACSVTLKP